MYQMFTVIGSMATKPGGARYEFTCKASARTVDEVLDKFKEIYSPDSYKVVKISSVELGDHAIISQPTDD